MLVAAVIAGCLPSKAPTCRVDADCRKDTMSAYCFESKCVECRSDDDCKLPKMCGPDHTCFNL
jgi:hypothetical protein